MYYRGSKVVLIVYDITNRDSYDGAKEWLTEIIKSELLENPKIFLIGNKVDLDKKRQVSTLEV